MNIIKCRENHQRLFTNDQHIGSPEVDYKLISAELKTAKALDADIHIGGDMFDAIIPRDKRYIPSCMHRRLWGKNDVIGEQIKWAVEIYSPVKSLIRSCGKGNHEDELEKWHGFNPVKVFLEQLGIPQVYSGYSAYIKYPKKTIYYHHGSGSGTTMSSALAMMEQKSEFIEADVFWMGHRHHRLFGHLRSMKPGDRASRRYKDIKFIMPGSYLDTYSSTDESYGEKKLYRPQGKGGVWMCGGAFYYE